MLPKALLLDLDDTLIAFDHGLDLQQCWLEACNLHLSDTHLEVIPTLVEAIQRQARWHWSDAERHRVGRLQLPEARRQIITEALRQSGILKTPETALQIARSYGKLRDELITLHPGAVDTLITARSFGLRLALLTNGASEPQWGKINRFRLAQYFDQIIVEEDFGIGKPEPAVYKHALELLDVRAEDAWMVGDNYEWEIAAPAKLGIRGIWINPAGKSSPAGIQPYLTLRTIEELKHELTRRID
ncbi:HAD family hydrolase [Paenibacillus antri]|uniref:HAD family hydrolase n=1 Tax=Paenibacillus antri TaxID=2582848 RepID=A0A5R9GDL7_9BACL|nr:HAD-IA family hydrolase [Paenibacillus antri]TLS50743.1 HAD family hydrolase [Paenibacillus antri]